MIRLIDENATKQVTISGTVFHIKQLSGAQKAQLSMMMRPDADGNLTGYFDVMLPVLAKGISKIEDFEDKPVAEVLRLMSDAGDIASLLSVILSYSTLTEDELKNSSSSPESNLQEQKSATVGKHATNTTQENKDSASTTTDKSSAKDPAEKV